MTKFAAQSPNNEATMTNPKALDDLASFMVEALRPLTEHERKQVLLAIIQNYCLTCGGIEPDDCLAIF